MGGWERLEGAGYGGMGIRREDIEIRGKGGKNKKLEGRGKEMNEGKREDGRRRRRSRRRKGENGT